MFQNSDDTPEDPWSDNTPSKPEKSSGPKEPFQLHKGKSSLGKEKNNYQDRYSGGGNPIDDLIEKFQDSLKRKKSGGNGGNNKGGPSLPSFSPKFGIMTFVLIGVLLWLSTGIYKVQDDGGEVAVILRFGEMVRIAQPGLHYRLPNPIENEIRVKIAVLNKIDGGLREDASKSSQEALEQTLILTGDENMIHTNYTVLWKIKDVADFIFTVRDPEGTIKVAAESAIREILGQTPARQALTAGRENIGTQAQELLQKILDMYKMGVQIVSIQLQRVEPPVQVIQAFNDMQASLVDADRLRNEAEAYRNDILPRARGEAEKIIQDAEAYQQQVVAIAEGEAARFSVALTAYNLHPEVAQKRLYLDTMQQVLKNAQKTIVDGKTSHGIVPYLNLQRDDKNNPQSKGESQP
ncbi:MAG: FtsH protease activity modulator HflK [Alphaproteobacteria bacterium]|nr:FtsH protease activity modulator HflK [Alphaproteobacteria bacterium]